LALGKAINPFMRPMSPEIQASIGMQGAPLSDIFAQVRKRKDSF
jgi:hydroxyacylglutathione hydrolase